MNEGVGRRGISLMPFNGMMNSSTGGSEFTHIATHSPTEGAVGLSGGTVGAGSSVLAGVSGVGLHGTAAGAGIAGHALVASSPGLTS